MAEKGPDRIAVVTGGARGIGRGIAERLAGDGLDVAVVDLADMRSELDEVAEAVRKKGRRCAVATCDVADAEDVAAMVSQVVRELGRIDVFVANAGIAKVKSLLDTTAEDFDQVMSVNLRGVFNSYQAAARQMIEQGHGGKIIGAASIVAYRPFEMLSAYSVSKWGVRGLTQAAATEWAKHGITVNAYCPGIVGTEMWELIDEKLTEQQGKPRGEALRENTEQILLGRVQEPADVAAFVSYLASPDSDYMTGQSVIIDGGIQFS
ncbi:acetoin reductase [Allosalinactinospora lopnorensis]|uniref:acetoin reductase n=1 Tax=Allosalinactinospora lopnorensis TaxID=1352348 RepID=UPI000623DECB|nr:acetoin reductase [Allosalinactinospora lopnorensis]